MNFFQRARRVYILHRYGIPHHRWESATSGLTILQDLSTVEKAHLRELSTFFLHDKDILGAQEIEITEPMAIAIAAQACLPVLHLGIVLLGGWSEVVVYPDAFRVERDEMDEFGVLHHGERILSGESWSRGPLIVSWRDIERDRRSQQQGRNVIVHEIAHKLDMLNGRANGMPPLHATMPIAEWTSAFSRAYRDLKQHLEHHDRVCINPYAATSPAEFFAVFSEVFFCAPEVLNEHYPEVYRQLRFYYRQDPLSRMAGKRARHG